MLRFSAIILATFVAVALSSTPSGKIEDVLQKSLETKGNADILISFVGGNRKVVESVEVQTFSTRTERLTNLKSSLERHASQSQQKVQEFLRQESVNFRSFWISNQILIRGANAKLVESLASFPEVEAVDQEKIVEYLPITRKPVKRGPTPQAEWGIDRVQAEEAWALGVNGSGVIVGSIDSGVRWSHEALRDQWRQEYGWFDAAGDGELPYDTYDHGTHTMGTIAGTHGIGVAPGARWITCGTCGVRHCGQAEGFLACGEWIVCPTKLDGSDPDCSMAPALVSNSWGIGRDDHWYEPVTEAWIAGGIIPIFALGNSGASCNTANSPGDYRRVIGVSSTNEADRISSFSSVGPAADRRIKPELAAPGEDVRSSTPQSDTSYGVASGTSMACPHVAGVTALLLSIRPNLTFGEVRTALLEGADHDLVSNNITCSGIDDSDWPNYHFGYGMVNALRVVQNAKRALESGGI